MLTAVMLVALQVQLSRPIVVTHDGQPVAGAAVQCGAVTALTGADGRTAIIVPQGGCALVVTREGMTPATIHVDAGAGPIEVALEDLPEVEEAVVVTATRTGRLASDQPLRVEVVSREEIQEKLLMTPGDIAMLLNETSGIRLQATSPALGASAVRVQGLKGRYTPVLTDGLPINSTQASPLGLLQVPPMDLQQVEVIKGAASALYGASALGGVINLVSRAPTEDHQAEALFNLTSRGGTDGVFWLSGPAGGRRGYTLLAGVHTQEAADVDADGWSDLPRYRRFLARPRLTTASDRGSFDVSGTILRERRTGGTHDSAAYVQSVDTWRGDGGAVLRRIAGRSVVVARGSISRIAHDHRHGPVVYGDRHGAQFAEVSISRLAGAHAFVAGAAVDRQTFSAESLSGFDYTWTTPGVFVQDDWAILRSWTVSASARLDRHPEYGTFASPRVSSLVRARGWEVRVSYGGGFFAPTPLTEETDEVGLTFVEPPSRLSAERGRTWSADVSRRVGWVELSVSGFGSRIRDPLAIDEHEGRLVFTNRSQSSRTAGAEVFARLRRGPWIATASHAWVGATEVDRTGVRGDVPLTPRRSWAVVAAWERHGVARVGFEIYRTGGQRLDDNPYAATSPPYTIIGVLAERRFGPLRAFINFENLTDVRLSKTHPLLRPSPSPTGRRTVDAWAPLEGRTINGGVRVAW